MPYAPDEFDEVPADVAFRGAHRGQVPDSRHGYRGLVWTVVAGLAALALGAGCFLMAPRSSAPSSGSGGDLSAAKGWEGNPESASAPAADGQQVGVYNQSAVAGAASAAAKTLREQGWSVQDVSSWEGTTQETSVVLYSPGHKDQARQAAKDLGLSETAPQKGLPCPVAVVLDEQAPGPSPSSQG